MREVVRVDAAGALLDRVFAVYRQNSDTLGFLPRGAFEEFAAERRVVAICEGGEVLGYVAWRRPSDAAVLVHLCVSKERRQQGVASDLMRAFLAAVDDARVVRLRCRQDWEARELWPKFQFVLDGERPGRGQDGGCLQLWKREQDKNLDLFDYAQEQRREERLTVAVDAMVFFDLNDVAERADESRALLADWLIDTIAVFATDEIKNEIGRSPDAARRREGMRWLAGLDGVLAGTASDLARIEPELRVLLPREQEWSDRLQLAHAIAAKADVFVTRDERVLEVAAPLRERFALDVCRPLELVLRLHADTDAATYVPQRLLGTSVTSRKPTAEAELLHFQRFSAAEPKAEWLTNLRRVLADPVRYDVQVVSTGTGDPPVVLYALDKHQGDVARVPLLRSVRHGLSGTVLRRVIATLIEGASRAGQHYVACDDGNSDDVAAALRDLGFVRGPSGYQRALLRGIYDEDAARAALEGTPAGREVAAACPSAADLERACWPAKVRGQGIPAYIVPIWPVWAAALFDARLAESDLFGAPNRLALGLENVYYSASPIRIPSGSRILWYVSGGPKNDGPQEIRACSRCIDTVTAENRSHLNVSPLLPGESAIRRQGV